MLSLKSSSVSSPEFLFTKLFYCGWFLLTTLLFGCNVLLLISMVPCNFANSFTFSAIDFCLPAFVLALDLRDLFLIDV